MRARACVLNRPAGIRVRDGRSSDVGQFFRRVEELAVHDCISVKRDQSGFHISLQEHLAKAWLPENDTTRLSLELGLDPAECAEDLEREVVLAILMAPMPIEFPSFGELAAAIRVRMNIAAAARKTQLAFDTEAAERPADYWTYDEDCGFTIRPGRSLIAGLQKATQPDPVDPLYSFSCYRATEYVVLLGIAQELANSNPPLLAELQAQWEAKAVKSGAFHDAFLYEYGSMQNPVPMRYYIPGDRVWFRNPDAASSDVAGFEGSWVIYLGGGLFSNFWCRDRPYTLATKSVEIYHWRHGLRQDQSGRCYIDEDEVARQVAGTLACADATADVLGRIMRLRDPSGVYGAGGCIDATREFPRWVRPGTSTIQLPKGCRSALASIA